MDHFHDAIAACKIDDIVDKANGFSAREAVHVQDDLLDLSRRRGEKSDPGRGRFREDHLKSVDHQLSVHGGAPH